MAVGYLDSQYLTDIANAIRTKAGTTAQMSVSDMPTEIANIPTGGGDTPRVFKDVNFFDYDGTILYQYDLAEANALTELPPLPASPRAGYTADSWTETLSFIQNLTGPCDVGVNYTTTNNFSEIKLSIPEDNYQVCTAGGQHDNNGTYIDWGDGTAQDVISKTKRVIHTYAQRGDYYIKLSATWRDYCMPSVYSRIESSSSSNLLTMGSMFMPYPFVIGQTECDLIKEIWMGMGLNMSGFQIYLANCKSLEKILYPQNVASSQRDIYFYANNASFRHFTIPSNWSAYSLQCDNGGPESIVIPSSSLVNNSTPFGTNTKRVIMRNCTLTSGSQYADKPNLELLLSEPSTYNTAAFSNDSNLKNVTINCASITTGMFMNCKNLKRIDLSLATNTTALPDYAFQNTPLLKEVILPNTLTSFGNMCFASSGIETFTIPETVTSLGTGCFRESELTGVMTLPASCQTIGIGCFQACLYLTEVHIKAAQITLSGSAFAYCSNLTSVYIYSTIAADQATTVFYNTPNVTIYVPRSALEDWKTAWSSMASKMQPWDPPTD